MTLDLSWRDQAACVGMPHAFFAGRWTALAKRLCLACPVMDECLFFALSTEDHHVRLRHGVWGGTTPSERQRLVNEDPRLHPSRILEVA